MIFKGQLKVMTNHQRPINTNQFKLYLLAMLALDSTSVRVGWFETRRWQPAADRQKMKKVSKRVTIQCSKSTCPTKSDTLAVDQGGDGGRRTWACVGGYTRKTVAFVADRLKQQRRRFFSCCLLRERKPVMVTAVCVCVCDGEISWNEIWEWSEKDWQAGRRGSVARQKKKPRSRIGSKRR